METRAHHVLIGLFTVAAVLGALLFALWLGKSSLDRDFDNYEILFDSSVSGLAPGSLVEYNGIRVGNVEQLWLDPQDPRKVHALIRVYAGTPVKQDTQARLALANITGNMNIQLHGGTPESPLLTSRRGPPLIIADPSPLTTLLGNGEDMMSNLNNLLSSANRILSPENTNHLSHTLEHLEVATEAIASQREEFRQTLQHMNSLGKQAGLAMEEITKLTHTANGLLDEHGSDLMNSAKHSMAALDRSTSRLDKLLADNDKALDSGLQGVADLGPAIGELRATLASLRRVTQHLEDNPSGFLLGREKLQEFNP